jgi:hypothetical protein
MHLQPARFVGLEVDAGDRPKTSRGDSCVRAPQAASASLDGLACGLDGAAGVPAVAAEAKRRFSCQ